MFAIADRPQANDEILSKASESHDRMYIIPFDVNLDDALLTRLVLRPAS